MLTGRILDAAGQHVISGAGRITNRGKPSPAHMAFLLSSPRATATNLLTATC